MRMRVWVWAWMRYIYSPIRSSPEVRFPSTSSHTHTLTYSSVHIPKHKHSFSIFQMPTAIAMNKLTSVLATANFGVQPASYKKAFNDLVAFAEGVRDSEIPAAELDVTTRLAGPFTSGGLLVLLQEPQRWHPWDEGVEGVIADCKPLELVETGIDVASRGALSMTTNVSVLDSRPLLVRKEHPHVRLDEWWELNRLVARAIEAKRPDVILCMGRVRGSSGSDCESIPLNNEQAAEGVVASAPSSRFWQNVRVIRTPHPSFFLDYSEDDTGLCAFFPSVYVACHYVQEEDASRLVRCLEMLMQLCFKPDQFLPVRSIDPEGLFVLLPAHLNWLDGTVSKPDRGDPHALARACLIPVFKELNRCVKQTGLFSRPVEVDWARAYSELGRIGDDFENACYLLAGSEYTYGRAVEPSDPGEYETPLSEFERILLTAEEMWDSSLHPPRLFHCPPPDRLSFSIYV